jgi:hypothetical protein
MAAAATLAACCSGGRASVRAELQVTLPQLYAAGAASATLRVLRAAQGGPFGWHLREAAETHAVPLGPAWHERAMRGVGDDCFDPATGRFFRGDVTVALCVTDADAWPFRVGAPGFGDLVAVVPVGPPAAYYGFEAELPHPSGRAVRVRHAGPLQGQATHVERGAGLVREDGSRGDAYVVLQPCLPALPPAHLGRDDVRRAMARAFTAE